MRARDRRGERATPTLTSAFTMALVAVAASQRLDSGSWSCPKNVGFPSWSRSAWWMLRVLTDEQVEHTHTQGCINWVQGRRCVPRFCWWKGMICSRICTRICMQICIYMYLYEYMCLYCTYEHVYIRIHACINLHMYLRIRTSAQVEGLQADIRQLLRSRGASLLSDSSSNSLEKKPAPALPLVTHRFMNWELNPIHWFVYNVCTSRGCVLRCIHANNRCSNFMDQTRSSKALLSSSARGW